MKTDANTPLCDASPPLARAGFHPHDFTDFMTTSATVRLHAGLRAHDLGRFAAEELARRVAAAGFGCVQLALGKAIEGVDLAHGIPDGLATETRTAFDRHGVAIEILGCYINPIHPDLETRSAAIRLFKQHLRQAADFGCRIVALESGSLNPDQSLHPGNTGEPPFLDLLQTMRELVNEAEDCGAVVGIEAVTAHVLHSPERMRRLLEEISSPNLQVVFDPVNLLDAHHHQAAEEIISRSLESFGSRIAAVHAKDYRIQDGRFITVPAGDGMLDYTPLMSWIRRHRPGIAVLLEEARPDDLARCLDFLETRFNTPTA